MKVSKGKICFDPIGIIHTPYKEPLGTPIQPVYSDNALATVEVFEEFSGGLDDIAGFSHIYLLYVFDRSEGFRLKVQPYMDDKLHGVFTTRAPRRPNPIGLSVVNLIKRERNILTVKNVDILDNTPLLDIKPFVNVWDLKKNIRIGWLEGKLDKNGKYFADDRFK